MGVVQMEFNVAKIGRWSAALSTIFGIAYILPQIAVVMGMIPSPLDLISLFVPSFFLASAFLVLMVSICYYAPQNRRVWGHIGAAFAIAYAVLVSFVYFVELTVVIPQIIQGKGNEVTLLLFNPGSFMQAIDGLGYGFMSLSTLFAAQVFDGAGLFRWTRWALRAHGILAPAILLSVMYPVFIAIGVMWIFTFPISAILLYKIFSRPR
jgi:hypothetical protein